MTECALCERPLDTLATVAFITVDGEPKMAHMWCPEQ